ncbi:hypothetical protein FA95DRAFT_1595394 [Auriscalpium vulgare]|uniref:Uncharacterized protein n=1 Tax=Auriscalpium vulgare TaxID=40419 RepID=A0ACB8RV76_9AGAM|nr:hypothetical protein FA95DRAFT_1595394 [Auriscalpium vulgare]
MGNSRSRLPPPATPCHESSSMTTSSTLTVTDKLEAASTTAKDHADLTDKPYAASDTAKVVPSLGALVKDHADLNKVDPAVLSVALFKAMGYSDSVGSDKFYPPAEFVTYLEFIECKARGNTSRTKPAESLSEAAYTFLSRSALPPSSTPSFPRNLVTKINNEGGITNIMIANEGDLSKADRTRLAARDFS